MYLAWPCVATEAQSFHGSQHPEVSLLVHSHDELALVVGDWCRRKDE
jgi:hypothetical protein